MNKLEIELVKLQKQLLKRLRKNIVGVDNVSLSLSNYGDHSSYNVHLWDANGNITYTINITLRSPSNIVQQVMKKIKKIQGGGIIPILNRGTCLDPSNP